MVSNPDRHRRRSIRLPGYDYSGEGVYFVTVCVHNRECILGDIVDTEMRLNHWGRIAVESWEWLEQRYPYVSLDRWVMMPNHIHGIIVIRTGASQADSRGMHRTQAPHKPLGQLIGVFKTVSTKRINVIRWTPGAPLWQRNYYEHVIRSEKSLNAIREYIEANPLRWANDEDNPDYVRSAGSHSHGQQ